MEIRYVNLRGEVKRQRSLRNDRSWLQYERAGEINTIGFIDQEFVFLIRTQGVNKRANHPRIVNVMIHE
jgi:hypothetical protein